LEFFRGNPASKITVAQNSGIHTILGSGRETTIRFSAKNRIEKGTREWLNQPIKN
jgi:hypothetical protein